MKHIYKWNYKGRIFKHKATASTLEVKVWVLVFTNKVITQMTRTHLLVHTVFQKESVNVEERRNRNHVLENQKRFLKKGKTKRRRVLKKEKIVLNIGAGVAIEKEPDAAINFLESRIKEVEVALQDTAAKKQDAVARLEQGKQEINRMMQSQPPSS